MDKQTWVNHIIEASGGLVPPSQGGSRDVWVTFLKNHHPRIGSVKHWCTACKTRDNTRKAAQYAKDKREAYASCGMTRVVGALGGVYYE